VGRHDEGVVAAGIVIGQGLAVAGGEDAAQLGNAQGRYERQLGANLGKPESTG
jgi:hypothetical protein